VPIAFLIYITGAESLKSYYHYFNDFVQNHKFFFASLGLVLMVVFVFICKSFKKRANNPVDVFLLHTIFMTVILTFPIITLFEVKVSAYVYQKLQDNEKIMLTYETQSEELIENVAKPYQVKQFKRLLHFLQTKKWNLFKYKQEGEERDVRRLYNRWCGRVGLPLARNSPCGQGQEGLRAVYR
jgi:hypothetical protein